MNDWGKKKLNGFTGTREAKYEGKDQEYAPSHVSYKKIALTRRISHENPPYFACADFVIFPIDQEWSQALWSFKMKV